MDHLMDGQINSFFFFLSISCIVVARRSSNNKQDHIVLDSVQTKQDDGPFPKKMKYKW